MTSLPTDRPPAVDAGPGSTRGDVVLQAVDLQKHFKLRGGSRDVVHAVDDVNLELRRGHVLALVGESGSGKSTIARLLAQLMPATGGRILLHGEDAATRGRRAFRRYVGRVQMIFQDPFGSLNPVHTVRYTLTRSIRIHRGRLRGAALEDALVELLDRVQLTPAERYVDKFPHELSGGQRQRVAIARALAADPEVLLADEPISMLDVSIRLGILNLLQDLRDRLHLAILYITHDIASARYFADRTMVMYAGRIVESGDSESVTQDPKHPYTQLLVRSAPDPDDLEARAHGARGEAPSLVRPPSGCRFNPRCPFATDLCRAEVPPLMPVGDGPRGRVLGLLRPPRPPGLGSVLDAFGERPVADDLSRPCDAADGCALQTPRSRIAEPRRRTRMRFFLRRFMFYVITFWAAVTINFLIPRLLPGDPVSALIAKNQGRISPDADRGAARALRPRPGRVALAAVPRLLGTDPARRARHLLHVLPDPGDRGHPAGPAMDDRARGHRDDHQLHDRHAHRHRHRLAARHLGRLAPADLDVLLVGAVLLARAHRHLALLGDARLVPRERQLRPVARPDVVVGVHRLGDLLRLPAGDDDRHLVDRRVDPRHAQHDGHRVVRGLRHRRPGEGALGAAP